MSRPDLVSTALPLPHRASDGDGQLLNKRGRATPTSRLIDSSDRRSPIYWPIIGA